MMTEDEARRRLRGLLPARLHPWIATLDSAAVIAAAEVERLRLEAENYRRQQRRKKRRAARLAAEAEVAE